MIEDTRKRQSPLNVRKSKDLSPTHNQRNTKFNATSYAGKERESPELDLNTDGLKTVEEVLTVPSNLDRPRDPNQTKSFKIYPSKA